MILRPCPACRRHVDATAAHCVFCTTTLPGSFVFQLERAGRFSRAAVFAGATLASSACIIQQEAPPQAPPPPPVTSSAPEPTPPRTPDAGVPVVTSTDASVARPATAGPLTAHLRDSQTGGPIVEMYIYLGSVTGDVTRSVLTDASGTARFDGLPVGRYVVSAPSRMIIDGANERYVEGAFTRQEIELGPQPSTLEMKMTIVRTTAVRAPIPKPYGAPPARRRTV